MSIDEIKRHKGVSRGNDKDRLMQLLAKYIRKVEEAHRLREKIKQMEGEKWHD